MQFGTRCVWTACGLWAAVCGVRISFNAAEEMRSTFASSGWGHRCCRLAATTFLAGATQHWECSPLQDNWSHNMGMQLGHNVRLLAMDVGARLIAPG